MWSSLDGDSRLGLGLGFLRMRRGGARGLKRPKEGDKERKEWSEGEGKVKGGILGPRKPLVP